MARDATGSGSTLAVRWRRRVGRRHRRSSKLDNPVPEIGKKIRASQTRTSRGSTHPSTAAVKDGASSRRRRALWFSNFIFIKASSKKKHDEDEDADADADAEPPSTVTATTLTKSGFTLSGTAASQQQLSSSSRISCLNHPPANISSIIHSFSHLTRTEEPRLCKEKIVEEEKEEEREEDCPLYYDDPVFEDDDDEESQNVSQVSKHDEYSTKSYCDGRAIIIPWKGAETPEQPLVLLRKEEEEAEHEAAETEQPLTLPSEDEEGAEHESVESPSTTIINLKKVTSRRVPIDPPGQQQHSSTSEAPKSNEASIISEDEDKSDERSVSSALAARISSALAARNDVSAGAASNNSIQENNASVASALTVTRTNTSHAASHSTRSQPRSYPLPTQVPSSPLPSNVDLASASWKMDVCEDPVLTVQATLVPAKKRSRTRRFLGRRFKKKTKQPTTADRDTSTCNSNQERSPDSSSTPPLPYDCDAALDGSDSNLPVAVAVLPTQRKNSRPAPKEQGRSTTRLSTSPPAVAICPPALAICPPAEDTKQRDFDLVNAESGGLPAPSSPILANPIPDFKDQARPVARDVRVYRQIGPNAEHQQGQANTAAAGDVPTSEELLSQRLLSIVERQAAEMERQNAAIRRLAEEQSDMIRRLMGQLDQQNNVRTTGGVGAQDSAAASVTPSDHVVLQRPTAASDRTTETQPCPNQPVVCLRSQSTSSGSRLLAISGGGGDGGGGGDDDDEHDESDYSDDDNDSKFRRIDDAGRKTAIAKIQAFFRGCVHRKSLRRVVQESTLDQKSWRSCVKDEKTRYYAITIQKRWRAKSALRQLVRARQERPAVLHPLFDRDGFGLPSRTMATVANNAASAPTFDRELNFTLKIQAVSSSPSDKSWLLRELRNGERPSGIDCLAIDAFDWQPLVSSTFFSRPCPIKCRIFDIYGKTFCHPSTQSLLFSSNALYLLTWDLACTNQRACFHKVLKSLSNGCNEKGSQYVRKEANRLVDQELAVDISNRVLTWFDSITELAPDSVILPVAIVPKGFDAAEVQRRCCMMQDALESHACTNASKGFRTPRIFNNADGVLRLKKSDGAGNDELRPLHEAVMSLAIGGSQFDHVGTPAPEGTMLVFNVISELKRDKIPVISLEEVLAKVGSRLEVKSVVRALTFLADVGEILYFANTPDSDLACYIILSPEWLALALSCIFRCDLNGRLEIARQHQKHGKNKLHDVLATLDFDQSSHCPLLSHHDIGRLWDSEYGVREARILTDAAKNSSTPNLYQFLEKFLIHRGVLMPFRNVRGNGSSFQPDLFLVPSLLSPSDNTDDEWSFMTKESWKTTLSNAWLLHDGPDSDLMERLTVLILQDLYQFCAKEDSKGYRHTLHHGEFNKASMRMVIATYRGESFVQYIEVLVALAEPNSKLSVASANTHNVHRVVASGKGMAGHCAQALWNGGYQVIVDACNKICAFRENKNVEPLAICPDCLLDWSPRSATAWHLNDAVEASKRIDTSLFCNRGHTVDGRLVCGSAAGSETTPSLIYDYEQPSICRSGSVRLKEVFPSVVLVAVWDPLNKCVVGLGSGFIVDKRGLIVTAAHVLFPDKMGLDVSNPTSLMALIGVTADGKADDSAVFRYIATIATLDTKNVDGCVLRIHSRLESNIRKDGKIEVNGQPQKLDAVEMLRENLVPLDMTTEFEKEQLVRVAGFSQGGEGHYEPGQHVCHDPDFGTGHICREFTCPGHLRKNSADFHPRKEIVLEDCKTIGGQSGGPCVSVGGQVIGILSRADPQDPRRCYVAPVSEFENLVREARLLLEAQPSTT